MRLRAYPSTKDSGVEWLGQVPEHWEVKRLGHYFQERREKVSDRDFQALSVTKNGVVLQLETAAKTDDGDNRKKVRAGDFVINSRSDRKGSSGVSLFDGSVSLISTVLQPEDKIDSQFVHHLLRSQPFQEEYYRYGKGIVADLWSTNYSEMKNIILGVPPLDEQRAIAAFLDRETARLDTLIAKQERLIELSMEKRRALISHAVTRGLDASAPLKDSGVEWLGQVPKSWDVKRLKYLLVSIEQGWSPACENRPADDEEWGVLKAGCVNGNEFNANEQKALPPDIEPLTEYEIKPNDVLMSRANTRQLLGSASVVGHVRSRLLLCDKLYRLNLDAKAAAARFVVELLGTSNCRYQIEREATGTSGSMQNIGQDTVKEIRLCLPPLSEQRAIVKYLDGETAKIDTLIAKARRSIELMKEHRASLIAAAVTGKIDVRGDDVRASGA